MSRCSDPIWAKQRADAVESDGGRDVSRPGQARSEGGNQIQSGRSAPGNRSVVWVSSCKEWAIQTSGAQGTSATICPHRRLSGLAVLSHCRYCAEIRSQSCDLRGIRYPRERFAVRPRQTRAKSRPFRNAGASRTGRRPRRWGDRMDEKGNESHKSLRDGWAGSTISCRCRSHPGAFRGSAGNFWAPIGSFGIWISSGPTPWGHCDQAH